MKRTFRPTHTWPHWRPHRGALHALLNLAERTWAEPSVFNVELVSSERTDVAENADEARELLDTESLFSTATSIDVTILGPGDSVGVLTFRWHSSSGSGDLAAAGSDEISARTLRDRAVEILQPGTVDPSDIESPRSTPMTPAFEQQQKLELTPGRFAGTYGDLVGLVAELADLVRQVRGTMHLDSVYIALIETGGTISGSVI